MINEITVGGVVVNNGKIIIVFQNKTQTWSLPKGHINNNESPEQTARREIYEESGISDLTFVKKLGSYTRGTKKNPSIQKQITIMQFTTTQTNLSPIDPENPEAKWVLIDDVADLLSYDEDKNFFLKIKKILNNQNPMFEKQIKNLHAYDISLIKSGVMAFTLFVITVWPAANNLVHSIHWGWYLGAMIIFLAKPFHIFFLKK